MTIFAATNFPLEKADGLEGADEKILHRSSMENFIVQEMHNVKWSHTGTSLPRGRSGIFDTSVKQCQI